MTIEEKARAYDEAIEKIKYVMEHGVSPVLNKEDLQGIFPELKESEDERIRKALLRFHHSTIELDGIKGGDIISWLEKQGDKDKLIKELGKYKVKYTQEVLSQQLEKQSEKPKWSEEGIREAQLDYWRSVGGKEWHGVPVQETIAWLEKQGELKWSEEDEIGSDVTIELLEYFINYAPEFRRPTIRRSIDWLKSLKKRMEET